MKRELPGVARGSTSLPARGSTSLPEGLSEGGARPVDRSIAQVVAWLARQSEGALGSVDLTLPQFRVLALLSHRDALPSSLADRIDVGRSAITAVVDGLVSRGLVLRVPHAEDRRKVTHVITPEGRRVLRDAEASITDRLEAIAGVLRDEGSRAAAFEGLEHWGAALETWRDLRHAEHEARWHAARSERP